MTSQLCGFIGRKRILPQKGGKADEIEFRHRDDDPFKTLHGGPPELETAQF